VARFCSLLYCSLWLGCCICFNEKTTLVLESGLSIFVLRTCQKLAFVNGREAKKATKREALRWKALSKDAIQGCRRNEM